MGREMIGCAVSTIVCILAGCASESFAPELAPEFCVLRPNAPFYLYGPQQPTPPDARLRRNERVKVLRKEFGFSLVQLGDQRIGYLANEYLAPAPPIPMGRAVPREQFAPAPVNTPVNLPPVEPDLPESDFTERLPDAPANGNSN